MSVLSSWVKKNGALNESALNGLLPFLPYGCKTPKGRFEVLRWLVPYRTACSSGALLQMADSVLDGVLDKDKNTRNAAMDLFETMLQRCSVDRILDLAKQRRQADLLQIRSIISAFTAAPAAEKKPVVPVGVAEVAEERKDDFQQRKEALGKRAGARVLAKPKLGPDGKPLPKYNVKSSIPKPMPRRTFDALRSNAFQPLRSMSVTADMSRLPVPLQNSAVGSPVMTNPIPSNPIPTNPIVSNPIMNNSMVSNPMVSNPVMTSPLDAKGSPGLEAPLHEPDRLTQLTLNSNGCDSLSSTSPDEADRVEFDGPVSAAQLFLPLTLPARRLLAVPGPLGRGAEGAGHRTCRALAAGGATGPGGAGAGADGVRTVRAALRHGGNPGRDGPAGRGRPRERVGAAVLRGAADGAARGPVARHGVFVHGTHECRRRALCRPCHHRRRGG